MEKKLNKLYLLIAAIILSSCTINYNNQTQEIEKSDSIPDSVMKNFSLVQIKNNKPYSKVSASLTEIYNTKEKTVLYDAKFSEFSNSGDKKVTEGQADSIEYFNDTEDAHLTGNLIFSSTKDDIKMNGEDLYWNHDEKIISSKPDSSISVIKGDGSEIKGFGFSANIRNSTFSFEKNVSGITP